MRTARLSPHSLTLRWRLLLVALVGVGAALAIGSLVLYAVLGVASQHALDDTARNTAADVSALMAAGPLPDPLPVSGAQLVQVVDNRDRVVGGSATADRLTSLLLPDELRRARNGDPLTIAGDRVGIAGTLRVVAVPATPAGQQAGSRSVIVAIQFGDVQHAERVLGLTLILTYPLLLATLGVIAWWLIGRTLRPVEALRSGAEAIGGSRRDERLPMPRQNDEIHALALTLNSMLDRLSAARERQRGFVADAAHELRSPLASMRTQLEVAEHLGEGGDLTRDLLADLTRLSGLVEDLLLLARSDADDLPARPVSCLRVEPLLGEVATRYATARVPVEVGPVDSGVSVDTAPDELRRVLTNLVDNAVRHARTRVELGARTCEGAVLLEVSDDGPGIPPERREHVFERFARLDDARSRDAGGTGLGLAIVRELVRRSGGTITLADQPPAADGTPSPGLRVEVRLPRPAAGCHC